MEKENKSEIHITNNFNAPIGQHIDHVDTINFSMDGDGTFHFGTVENMKKETTKQKELNMEELARAIENCQVYFWGNSAYAVLFCICRDDYKRENLSMSKFENMIEMLPYKQKRSHTCPAGTIANAFSDNPIYSKAIDSWNTTNAKERILKLRNMLRKELNL